ncbi:MAG: S-layer homology domain-containing protein [Oscillospiraceae bacterium]|nr:S-layer homology domain-containing protein [Oscillospiraceae bacterium]
MKTRRILALLLSVVMLLGMIPWAAAEEMVIAGNPFAEIEEHWAAESLTRALKEGWIRGDDTGINPNGILTRAQLAAIVRRIFNMNSLEDLTGYTDVPKDAWYAEDIAAARRMQVLFGSDLKMRPNDAITREEAFCVMARLLCLEDGQAADLAAFSDASSVSTWAKGAVSALVRDAYANGADGKLNPKANITRAEIVTLLDRMITTCASKVYEQDVDGNLVVTAPDTELKNLTVSGDLVLSDAIGVNDIIRLENVRVQGRVVLRATADKAVVRDDKCVFEQGFAKSEQLNYTVESLGSMNQAVYTMYSDDGVDKDGNVTLYTVNTGTPAATLIGVDPISGKQVLSVTLEVDGECMGGAWGVLGHSSGDVYLAGYTNAYLFRYSPKTGTLENLGRPTKDCTLPIKMTEDEHGVIWGGQATTDAFYSFDPKTDTFTEYNLGGLSDGQYHVCRAEGTDDLYISSRWSDGTAHLYRMNLKTGKKVDIIPEKYIDTAKCIYDMQYVDGKLFCRTEVGSMLFVVDAATGEQISFKNLETGEEMDEILMYGRATSLKSPIEDAVYFTGEYQIYKYNLKDNTIEYLNDKLPDQFATGPLNFSFVELDDPNFPGWTIISSQGNLGGFFRYNFEKGTKEVFQLDIKGNPTQANSSILGNNGKVYFGGYIGSSTGSYDPATGEFEQLVGLRQIEGLGVYENYLFFGRYPNANIAKYDTTKPWNWDATSGNPYTVVSLGANANDPTYPNQDRPYNLLGIPEEGVAVFTSVPKQGYYGSAIGYHDMKDPTKPVKVDHTIVEYLSISSIAYAQRKVLFGTSIRPGSNTDPKAEEAELFAYDFETGEYRKYGVVIPKAVAYNALVAAPDGTIWGLANLRDDIFNSRLFIFDPASEKIVFQKDVSIYNFGATWYGFKMTVANDGKGILVSNLYNTGIIPENYRQTGDLFRIDLATKDVTVLIRDFGRYHVEDKDGNLYGAKGSEIFKYVLE